MSTDTPNRYGMDEVICKEVIISTIARRGNGTTTPIRVITQVFEKDGTLIAEYDPHPDVTPPKTSSQKNNPPQNEHGVNLGAYEECETFTSQHKQKQQPLKEEKTIEQRLDEAFCMGVDAAIKVVREEVGEAFSLSYIVSRLQSLKPKKEDVEK